MNRCGKFEPLKLNESYFKKITSLIAFSTCWF